MKLDKFKKVYLFLILTTIIVCSMLLLLPIRFSVNNRTEEVKFDLITRVETISKVKSRINLITVVPFMCDTCYLVDTTVDKEELKELNSKMPYHELKDNEQRLVFFYQNQLISDLTLNKDELFIDIAAGRINAENGWLNIGKNDLRLYN